MSDLYYVFLLTAWLFCLFPVHWDFVFGSYYEFCWFLSVIGEVLLGWFIVVRTV